MALLFISHGATALQVVDCGAASIAKLTPTDNKDAYFVARPNYYGVFDGVSQGPESREYAQMLASESNAYLCGGGGGTSWTDQARSALLVGTEKAGAVSGMSTALLLRMDLKNQQLNTYSIGDCCALILRDKGGSFEVADVSGVSYHDNGAPYQLAGGEWISDSVDDGAAETFGVTPGDVVLGFSDGVTGNLALNQVAEIVTGCAAQSADDVAQAVAEQAQAAGRVPDDITVVVVRLGDGVGESAAVAAGAAASVPLPPADPEDIIQAKSEDGLEGLKGAFGDFFSKAADAAAEKAKAAAAAAAEGAKDAAAKAAKAAADKAKDALNGK